MSGWNCENKGLPPVTRNPGYWQREGKLVNPGWATGKWLVSLAVHSNHPHDQCTQVIEVEWEDAGDCGPTRKKGSNISREQGLASPSGRSWRTWRTYFQGEGDESRFQTLPTASPPQHLLNEGSNGQNQTAWLAMNCPIFYLPSHSSSALLIMLEGMCHILSHCRGLQHIVHYTS